MTSEPKSLLALSLGTFCGWARIDVRVRDLGGTTLAHGTWSCVGTPSARLNTFRYYLDQQLALGVNRLFVYGRAGKMHIALTEACAEHRVSYQPLDIVQVRRFATNSGRSDTVALVAAVRAWGFEPTNANAATAIACLQWAFEEGA